MKEGKKNSRSYRGRGSKERLALFSLREAHVLDIPTLSFFRLVALATLMTHALKNASRVLRERTYKVEQHASLSC